MLEKYCFWTYLKEKLTTTCLFYWLFQQSGFPIGAEIHTIDGLIWNASGKRAERYQMNKNDRSLKASENSGKIDFISPSKITTTTVQKWDCIPPSQQRMNTKRKIMTETILQLPHSIPEN